jgi:hypothetical protein
VHLSIPGTRRSSRDARHRCPVEKGAAAVEAALVTPLIVFLLFAILEAGNYAYSYLAVQDFAADAVRTGTISRNQDEADRLILASVGENLGVLKRSSIERIVIYKASSPDSDPPPGCLSGPAVSQPALDCSVYGADDIETLPSVLDCGWCGAERRAGDLLGLWIRFDHESLTGMFDMLSFTEHKILPIEPDL